MQSERQKARDMIRIKTPALQPAFSLSRGADSYGARIVAPAAPNAQRIVRNL
jgi:hypothetical protein